MDVALWQTMYEALIATSYVVLVCIVVEHIAATKRYSLRDRLPGSVLVLTGAVLSTAVSWPLQHLWYALDVGFLVVPLWDWLTPFGVAGKAAAVLCYVVIVDFLRYWRHRAEHRWFWAIHKVHHAPTELHAANSIGHPLQVIPDFLIVSIPLSLFQFPGAAIPVSIGFLTSFLALYIHSPVDVHFGPVRRVVVDNRFHRIHHSREPRHFDKNFGICFSVWDYLFGTAHSPAKDEWPEVGVDGEQPPRTIGQFLAMPFVSPNGSSPENGSDGAIAYACADQPDPDPILTRLDAKTTA